VRAGALVVSELKRARAARTDEGVDERRKTPRK
jgi:hypothetical protein